MLLTRSRPSDEERRGKAPLFPRRLVHEQPHGDSSHEHVIVAWRRKVVRIRPGKKFRAESNRSESSGLQQQGRAGIQRQAGSRLECQHDQGPTRVA